MSLKLIDPISQLADRSFKMLDHAGFIAAFPLGLAHQLVEFAPNREHSIMKRIDVFQKRAFAAI
ncbi:hypothetical protein DDZ18_03645 [Marinicauda salina]|uniref:Uncharacterized protein n=1 Tax=Marinicauda salina TaxID=2135793 RepID=A0A2U2BXH2_9PROT|nr:hypothetical protein DDZ18_03645 [Marinicauda salina]